MSNEVTKVTRCVQPGGRVLTLGSLDPEGIAVVHVVQARARKIELLAAAQRDIEGHVQRAARLGQEAVNEHLVIRVRVLGVELEASYRDRVPGNGKLLAPR